MALKALPKIFRFSSKSFIGMRLYFMVSFLSSFHNPFSILETTVQHLFEKDYSSFSMSNFWCRAYLHSTLCHFWAAIGIPTPYGIRIGLQSIYSVYIIALHGRTITLDDQDDDYSVSQKMAVLLHTSLKSKLAKNDFPEERTIYSESSWPGDFKNDLEIGLTNKATYKKFHQKIGNWSSRQGLNRGRRPTCSPLEHENANIM